MRATRAVLLAAAVLGALVSLSACGSAGGAGSAATLTPGVTAGTARPASGSSDPGGKEGY